MAEEMIGIRIDSELKEKIRVKMKEDGFGNMSDWVRDAILERLDPNHGIERTRRHVIDLLHNDSEIRKLLKIGR